MKLLWTYRCEFGHTWLFYEDEEWQPLHEDELCPFPHDEEAGEFRNAVTLTKERMVDFVELSIRPAARMVNSKRDPIGHEYEFYLVVRDVHQHRERMSRWSYTWDQAKQLLDRFRNQSPRRAWSLLDHLDTQSKPHPLDDARNL